MNRGIVIEVKGKKVIVLTPDGSFCTVKRSRAKELGIGEEVEFPPPSRLLWQGSSGKWWMSSLAAACLLVVLTYMVWNPFSFKEEAIVAYVHVDINPSVELSVNKQVEVINLEALNQEGEKLISSLNYDSRKRLDEVTLQLITLATEQGYLEKNHDVLISTSFTDEEDSEEYVQAIDLALDEVDTVIQQGQEEMNTTVKQDIYIHRLKTDAQLRTKAKEKGISPGKYSIYLQAREQGIETELEEIKNKSISEIAQELGGLGLKKQEKTEKPKKTPPGLEKKQGKPEGTPGKPEGNPGKPKLERERPTPPVKPEFERGKPEGFPGKPEIERRRPEPPDKPKKPETIRGKPEKDKPGKKRGKPEE